MDIRRLRPGDEQLAIATAITCKPEREREGYVPGAAHLHALMANDANYLLVAAEGDEPVGFLIAYRMPMFARDASMVYLYEIEVVAERRRRGIARGLIDLLKTLCRQDGVVEIWVGTENDNLPAIQLYQSTGAELENDDTCEFVYTPDTRN